MCVHVYQTGGRYVRVSDGLLVALRLQELADDPFLDDVARSQVAIALLFPDPGAVAGAFGDRLGDAVADLVGQAFGGEPPTHWDERDVNRTRTDAEHNGSETGAGANGREQAAMAPFDWDEDRDRIVATARGAYGLSWDELLDTPYREAVAMIALSPHETPMGQAIYYRTAEPPKPTKHNREEVQRFKELSRYYALRGTLGADMESMSDALAF